MPGLSSHPVPSILAPVHAGSNVHFSGNSCWRATASTIATFVSAIMLHVHRNGIGVAGVYTYEVAETKVAIVDAVARQHEFPLKCTLEPA